MLKNNFAYQDLKKKKKISNEWFCYLNGTLQFKNKRFIISEMIEGQRKVKDILEQNENYLMVIALWTRLLSREKERKKKKPRTGKLNTNSKY